MYMRKLVLFFFGFWILDFPLSWERRLRKIGSFICFSLLVRISFCEAPSGLPSESPLRPVFFYNFHFVLRLKPQNWMMRGTYENSLTTTIFLRQILSVKSNIVP